jgi:MFS family permease
MPQSRSGLADAFAALAYRDYRRFASSLLLTSLGAQLIQTAVLWHVYELTGSALLLGLTGLARAGPHMVLSLVGGVIADRMDRARLIQAGQAANAGLLLVLAALTVGGAIELWHLYVVTFLNGAFTAVSQPARTALIPSLVPRRQLIQAVGLNATIQQTSQIVGPALAGVTIGVAGLGATYSLTAVAYLAATLAIVGVRAPAPAAATGHLWQSFVEGMAFVRQRRVIVSLLVLDLGATVLGSYRALLPIFAAELGVGAGGFGALSAAPGVGSVLGSTVMLALGDVRYKGLYAVSGVLGYAAALVLLALSPWLALSLVAATLLGATDSVQMIPRNSVILAISPDALRGRVEAFRSMLSGGGPPLGYTLSGGIAAALGPALALVLGATACALLVVGVFARDRELRDPALGSVRGEGEPRGAPSRIPPRR